MEAQKRKGQVTAEGLLRCSGISAIAAGLLYIIIQWVHPSEQISSIHTYGWTAVAWLTLVMSLFALIGIQGLYVRGVGKAGWPGLIGFIVFGLFWVLSIAFSFVEAVVLPSIATYAPQYVEGVMGLFGEADSEVGLGALPVLAVVAGVMYALGGTLFGFGLFRAGVAPRPATLLLAVGGLATFAAVVIPHPFDRMLAFPMGLALIWLGSSQAFGALRRQAE